MTNDRLNSIYDRTHGCCHICRKKLSFTNYGVRGAKGSWEIEHSIPKAVGGTNHLNNLFAACMPCNRSKGAKSTRSVRQIHGHTRAPYSKEKKQQIRNSNILAGVTLFGIIGAGIAGPIGGIIGAVIGSEIGRNKSPNR